MPVIALDSYLVEFYNRVNAYWLFNSTGKLDSVTVLSTGGGHRDVHVRDGLTLLDDVMTSSLLLLRNKRSKVNRMTSSCGNCS